MADVTALAGNERLFAAAPETLVPTEVVAAGHCYFVNSHDDWRSGHLRDDREHENSAQDSGIGQDPSIADGR